MPQRGCCNPPHSPRLDPRAQAWGHLECLGCPRAGPWAATLDHAADGALSP